jgi:hypothetical protein
VTSIDASPGGPELGAPPSAPAAPPPAAPPVAAVAVLLRRARGVLSSLLVGPVNEMLLILVASAVYFGVRFITESGHEAAVDNAQLVIGFERLWGLDVEAELQNWALQHDWLMVIVNWVYMWAHWPLLAGTMIWLHRTRPDVYRRMRNTILLSGAVGLVIFAAFPVAPPRLLGTGFVDTITQNSSSYRVLQPPSLTNKYAAVPSFHVGWNFMVCTFIWRNGTRDLVRIAAAVTPVMMFVSVVLTANHYLVDGIIGIALVGAALAVVNRGERWWWSRGDVLI